MSEPICSYRVSVIWGRFRLEPPKALTALTLGMVRGFARALDEFGLDASVHAVLVTGEASAGFARAAIFARIHLPGAERGFVQGVLGARNMS